MNALYFYTFMIRIMIERLAIIFANSLRERRNDDNNHKLSNLLIDPFLYHSTDYRPKGYFVKNVK